MSKIPWFVPIAFIRLWQNSGYTEDSGDRLKPALREFHETRFGIQQK